MSKGLCVRKGLVMNIESQIWSLPFSMVMEGQKHPFKYPIEVNSDQWFNRLQCSVGEWEKNKCLLDQILQLMKEQWMVQMATQQAGGKLKLETISLREISEHAHHPVLWFGTVGSEIITFTKLYVKCSHLKLKKNCLWLNLCIPHWVCIWKGRHEKKPKLYYVI